MDLSNLKPLEMLNLHEDILFELKKRGIAKTRNQPVSECAKWLVRRELDLKEVKNPNEKYDGVDKDGKRYLVRSRNIIDNRAIQFSVIRNLENKNFDYLIIVTFSNSFKDVDAYKIAHSYLLEAAEPNNYQNGYIVKKNKLNLNDSRIQKLQISL